MTYVGLHQEEYAKILHIFMAIVAALLCVMQIYFVRKFVFMPVFLLPFLSFTMCFENSVISLGTQVSVHSITAVFTYIFQACQVPIFIVVLYETAYRLHEVRAARFWCIPFDEGAKTCCHTSAIYTVWMIRIAAVTLFFVILFVNFQQTIGHDIVEDGRGGYLFLAKHDKSNTLWASLVPPIILDIVGFATSYTMWRYFKNY